MTDKKSYKYNLVVMALFILVFSIAIRSIWVVKSDSISIYKWNDEFSITTNDAYHYATGLKKSIQGNIHGNASIRSGKFFDNNSGIIFTGYLVNKLTGLSIETITYYTPIVLSGLFGIFVFLICHILGFTIAGFIGGLIAVSSKIYFIRSRGGYFDTDIFALLVPIALIYLLLRIINSESQKTAVLTSTLLMTQSILYANNPLITTSIFLVYSAYILLAHSNNKQLLSSILIIVPSLIGEAVQLPASIKIALIIGMFLFVNSNTLNVLQIKKWVLVVLIAVMPLTNLATRGWSRLTTYFLPGDTISNSDNLELSYISFINIVEEAQTVSIEIFSELTSVSLFTVIASIAGLLFLINKRRESVLLIPLLIIGALALYAGERFSLYAVAPLSIGLAYLFVYIARLIKIKPIRVFVPFVLALPVLYSNITYSYNYVSPPVLLYDEALVLDKFGEISKPYDTLIAWWDYGYPIHYYSGRKTIAAGSASAQDMYILSSIFSSTSPQLTYDLSNAISNVGAQNIESKMKSNIRNDKNIYDNVKNINGNNSKNSTYIFLPYRMLGIFSQIYSIGSKDIKKGINKSHILYLPKKFQKNGNSIYLKDNKEVIDLQNGTITTDDGVVIPISKYLEVSYLDNEKPNKHTIKYSNNSNSNINVINLKSHKQIIILDSSLLNSFFIQAFFFENYDEDLMELTIRNKFSQIYKLN